MWTIPIRSRPNVSVRFKYQYTQTKKAKIGGTTAHTLASVTEPKVCQPKLLDVIFEGDTLSARIGLFDERLDGGEVFTRNGTVEIMVNT